MPKYNPVCMARELTKTNIHHFYCHGHHNQSTVVVALIDGICWEWIVSPKPTLVPVIIVSIPSPVYSVPSDGVPGLGTGPAREVQVKHENPELPTWNQSIYTRE
jgi:hypothetical protein